MPGFLMPPRKTPPSGSRNPTCRGRRTASPGCSGTLSPADAAQAKLWCTELQQRTIDRCLQLFGGYGYMLEYPIARAYADARITSIYGGTSEVMKTIIAKGMGL